MRQPKSITPSNSSAMIELTIVNIKSLQSFSGSLCSRAELKNKLGNHSAFEQSFRSAEDAGLKNLGSIGQSGAEIKQ